MTGLVENGYRIMIVPGGGPTDNIIEYLDKKHPFNPDTHHKACARAQDQTGLMISDPVWNGRLTPCETLEDIRKANDCKMAGVLLPSRLIFDLDPFERTWEITSDAMSVYFSWLTGAKYTIILTNVDGVYLDGDISNTDKLVKSITAGELELLGHTAVDVCTPAFLKAKRMNCFVMNGQHSETMINYLNGKEVIGTFIKWA
ncbi:MAG: amino acid kinase family protein [bacterium]